MTASEQPPAVQAFDRLAPEYDRLVECDTFSWQRASVHRLMARALSAGWKVLEIGCGAGHDTAFLAERGMEVVACDPSSQMLDRTAERLRARGLRGRVSLIGCGVAELESRLDADAHGPFDAIVSNFGALNCAPNLSPLGPLLALWLRPGGVAFIGLLGRRCLTEQAYLTLVGRRRESRRRLAQPPVSVQVAGVAVPTYYHAVSDLRAACGREIVLTAVVGLGVTVPPPYLEPRWQRLPSVARQTAKAIDRLVSAWPPFNEWGDHVEVQLRKRQAAHD